jgi:hypothetical protein
MYSGTKEERCQKRRNWYRNSGYSKTAMEKKTRRIQLLKRWLREHKGHLHCKCGESDIRCLDFHHRDPSKKVITIGRAVTDGWSIKRILTEIEKCDILCSNCHRKQMFLHIKN